MSKDWYVNSTNELGGIVSPKDDVNHQCKRKCCTLDINPVPPNGTQLGNNIGFTWGNELWFYGTKENKGKAICGPPQD